MKPLAERLGECSDPARRRRTVVVDSRTDEPIELSRLSSLEWTERVAARQLAERLGR